MSELEDDLFEKQLRGIDSSRPVFITGLPRAGTTLLLRVLHGTGEFATLTYRDMPFILAPVLWRHISKPFSNQGVKRERDHGDGMKISIDSPEAFEEVLWLAHLKRAYVRDTHLLILRPSDVPEQFHRSFLQFMTKVIYLHGRNTSARRIRYLSKNNANISRLDVLSTSFPDAAILVPFREPFAQARSLLRQHKNFLDRQAQNEFARRYMQWIGHYDFGLNFRPILFDPGRPPADKVRDTDLRFWLGYWAQAYRFCLAHKRANVHFIDYDRLRDAPARVLGAIGKMVGMEEASNLVDAQRTIRAPTTSTGETGPVNSDLAKEIRDIHQQLQASAL